MDAARGEGRAGFSLSPFFLSFGQGLDARLRPALRLAKGERKPTLNLHDTDRRERKEELWSWKGLRVRKGKDNGRFLPDDSFLFLRPYLPFLLYLPFP